MKPEKSLVHRRYLDPKWTPRKQVTDGTPGDEMEIKPNGDTRHVNLLCACWGRKASVPGNQNEGNCYFFLSGALTRLA